jgi:hypothetical protein
MPLKGAARCKSANKSFMIKQKIFLKTVLLTGMSALLVGNIHAQTNVRVLNASDTSCTGSGVCLNWTDSITGSPNPDPSLNVGGGYWSQTYFNTAGFNDGSFKLTHNSGASSYSYWSGFTSGANGDTRNYGFADTTGHVGSVNWVTNQWGIMAGGGLTSTLPVTVTPGSPYLIAYWDYFSDGIDPDSHSLQISLNGDSLFTPNEIYVCNHPWPYYGNFFGDGFARPLNQPGDYFILKIHGVSATNTLVGTVIDTLAVYDPSEPFGVHQNPNWHRISFPRWSNVKSLYFTMESTDEYPPYGPNTAVYFCLDKLKVTKTGGVASASVIPKKAKVPAVPKSVEVTDYFPVTSYTGGDVSVHNVEGKEVWKTTVKAGEKINLSKLPIGEYRLRHGHKFIPVKKN